MLARYLPDVVPAARKNLTPIGRGCSGSERDARGFGEGS